LLRELSKISEIGFFISLYSATTMENLPCSVGYDEMMAFCRAFDSGFERAIADA